MIMEEVYPSNGSTGNEASPHGFASGTIDYGNHEESERRGPSMESSVAPSFAGGDVNNQGNDIYTGRLFGYQSRSFETDINSGYSVANHPFPDLNSTALDPYHQSGVTFMPYDPSPSRAEEQPLPQRRDNAEESHDPSFSLDDDDSPATMAALTADVTSRTNSPRNATGLRRSKRRKTVADSKSDGGNDPLPVQEEKLDSHEQRLSRQSPQNYPDAYSLSGYPSGSMWSTNHPPLAVPSPGLPPAYPYYDCTPPVATAAGEYPHGAPFDGPAQYPRPQGGGVHAATPPHAAVETSPVPPDQAGQARSAPVKAARRKPRQGTKREVRRLQARESRNVASPEATRTHFEPSLADLEHVRTPRAKKALRTWYKRLDDLWNYKKTYGDCKVPQYFPEHRSLGIWVNKQRMEYKLLESGKRSSLTPKKIAALEEVGFVWAKPKGDRSWELRFEELKEYKERNGDCLVPTKCKDNTALGRWVSTQRSQYKKFRNGEKSSMTDERIDKLNEIGFTWNMT